MGKYYYINAVHVAERCDLSPVTLSRQTGLNKGSCSRILNKRICRVSDSTLQSLAQGLRIPSRTLLVTTSEDHWHKVDLTDKKSREIFDIAAYSKVMYSISLDFGTHLMPMRFEELNWLRKFEPHYQDRSLLEARINEHKYTVEERVRTRQKHDYHLRVVSSLHTLKQMARLGMVDWLVELRDSVVEWENLTSVGFIADEDWPLFNDLIRTIVGDVPWGKVNIADRYLVTVYTRRHLYFCDNPATVERVLLFIEGRCLPFVHQPFPGLLHKSKRDSSEIRKNTSRCAVECIDKFINVAKAIRPTSVEYPLTHMR